MPQIQPPGDRRDLVGGHRDIFGVEAALRILPIVRVDFVADHQPPHPGADFCDDAGAVIAENQWKMRLAGRKKSFPDIGVPSADAGGIDGDQNLPGIDFRDRQSVSGDHLGCTEAVDGGSEHGAGHMHRVMAGARKIAGAIEHDRDLTVGRSASWTWLRAAALTLVNFSRSNVRRRLKDADGYRERAACRSVGAVCELRTVSCCSVSGGLSAASIASSTRSSQTKRIKLRAFSGTSSRSLRLRAGSMTVAMPAWIAARTFSFTPPIGSTRPRSEISPVIAVSLRIVRPVISDVNAMNIATPALGPSFGIAPAGT